MAAHKHFSARDAGYRACYFEDKFDIVAGNGDPGPIEMVVTTPATGSYWMAIDVSPHQTVHVAIKEGVTNATPGTALVFRNRNRQGDHPDDCACAVEHSGTYTDGVVIFEKVELRGEPGIHTLLKQDTCYQITVTTKGDANYASVIVWVWQGSGAG